MTDPRPSWDEYGLALAKTAALRGDCTRRQVGAVLMDRQHRIAALGYNGAPAGEPGCLSAAACPRGRFTHDEIPSGLGNAGHAVPCIAQHAEINCLQYVRGRVDLKGTLYITCEPCPECWESICALAPGLRIVTPTRERHAG